MPEVRRSKGATTIDWGFLQLTTTAINRYRFNDLRKREKIHPEEVVPILRKRTQPGAVPSVESTHDGMADGNRQA